MIIQCTACRARYQIDPGRTAKRVARVKCPRCAEVFRITLPADAREPSLSAGKSAAVQAPPSDSSPNPTPTVLVVDDSRFFRELVLDVLKPLQLRFLTAADGQDALAVIHRERPDLVILDLNLPGMNGYDLIRQVRAEESLSPTRFLAMSGVYRKEADAAEVRHAGADDFIHKSFKPEQLQERVTALLPRHSRPHGRPPSR